MSGAVEFPARDGYRLAGTLFRAPQPAGRALSMNAAAGVPQVFYAKFAAELKRIAPADLGVRSIGHFGFFRERCRDTLWRDAADWLLAR